MYIGASLFTLVHLAVVKTVNLFSPKITWQLLISTPQSYKEIQTVRLKLIYSLHVLSRISAT